MWNRMIEEKMDLVSHCSTEQYGILLNLCKTSLSMGSCKPMWNLVLHTS